ncbi:hypothetical protein OSTOST_02368 [Ostertagia ostertagi]
MSLNYGWIVRVSSSIIEKNSSIKKMGYCVLCSEERLKRVWEFRGKKMPPANSPFRDDFLTHLKKLGYGNMTDQVAITTRAKEKIVKFICSQQTLAMGVDKRKKTNAEHLFWRCAIYATSKHN